MAKCLISQAKRISKFSASLRTCCISSKMSMEEFVEQQFMLLFIWFSLAEHGEEDGEFCDVLTIEGPIFEVKLLYDIDECKEEDDKRLFEEDGDIKQLLVSMFDSTLVFILTSSKLEDVEVSSQE